jgi:hypothetical protein
MTRLAILVTLTALTSPVFALEPVADLSAQKTERIDFQWQPQLTRRDQNDDFHHMVAQVNAADYQLDLKAYVGKRVRLYYLVPFDSRALISADALQISWPQQGRLSAGQAIADQRFLVFQGQIDEPVWRERLSLRLLVDSRRFNPPLLFQPRFEIELVR